MSYTHVSLLSPYTEPIATNLPEHPSILQILQMFLPKFQLRGRFKNVSFPEDSINHLTCKNFKGFSMRLPSILPFGFLLTRCFRANIHLELPHRPGAPAGGMWKGAGGSLGCRFGDLGTHLFLPDSVVTGSSAHRLLAERSVCGIKDPCYCHHQTIREQSATYGVPFGDGTCGC